MGCQKMQGILRGTSHGGPDSECNPMCEAVVTKVALVVNPKLWEEYCDMKDALTKTSRERGAMPALLQKSKATQRMQELCAEHLCWSKMETDINEVWAYHGTKRKAADSIVAMGFDPKRCLHGYYGKGFYLGQEACKSFQYTDAGKFSSCSRDAEACMIMCRVAIGQPD